VSAAGDGPLPGKDLEGLAEAAWWTAHPEERIDALERAFAAHVEDENPARAAHVALDLADEYNDRLQHAVGNGWKRRAIRLLDELPEGVEHGYLELAYARSSLAGDEIEEATRHAARVLDLGSRFGDRDLQAFGLLLQGMALISLAKVREGLSLIDEAAVAAVGGDVTPLTTGIIYCITIDVCRDLADYGRAGDWTEAAERWCERQAVTGFPGICRVHRAEIMRLRGALSDADREARRSIDELMPFGKLWLAGAGYYELGEVRLRMGDLDGAEDAFGQAHQLGQDPQPGMTMLHLAHGRPEAARSAIVATLADQQMPLSRARLLPARVEASLAAHDLADARDSAEELRDIAAAYDAPVLHAAAHQAIGAVLVHEGDAPGAVAELRLAFRHWKEADLPFESAESRRWLALAFRADGNEASAVQELRAAVAGFERIGARLEAERCDRLIEAGADRDAGRRVARAFMFTDIVGSTNLLETIGDEAWEDVMRWHNDTLQTLIRSHRGEVVHSTGDGFFASFDDGVAAATCAVSIQRRLAEHRREHGFAPPVRIGLHAAEATIVADDYTGIGVHEAARVGALADGGEIVVTCETVERQPFPFPVGDERAITLKGIARPVRVCSIEWRAAPL
jgi:class 3 adenylate cyclase